MLNEKSGPKLDRETARDRVLAFIAILLLSGAFGLWVVYFSYWHGRLATLPAFDDCGYMQDGGIRYIQMRQQGFFSLFTNYPKFLPHSPYASMMAVISYMIFGVKFYAPYALSTVLVFILLTFLNYLMKGLSLWRKVLVFGFALSVPFTSFLISDFRPDMACALFVSMGVILGLEREWTHSPWPRRMGIGALFGIAMFIKPSVFPQTIFFLCATLFGAILLDRWLDRPNFRFWKSMLSTGCAFLGFAAIALPHFSLTYTYYFYYIKLGMVSQRDIWSVSGTPLFHARYYLDGLGGKSMLGNHLYALAGLIAGAWIILLKSPGSKPKILRYGAMLALMGVAFLAPALNPVKTQFLGANFFCMLMLLGILSLLDIQAWLAAARESENLWFAAVCLVCLIVLPGYVPVAALFFAAIYFGLARHKPIATKALVYGIAGGILLGVYCIPSIRHGLKPYFEDKWHLAAAAAWTVAVLELHEYWRASRKTADGLMTGAVCALGLMLTHGPEYYGDRTAPDFVARAKTQAELFAQLKSRTQRPDAPAKFIFYTGVGPINEVTIGLYYLKEGMLPPACQTTDILSKPEEVEGLLVKADVIVASEANNPEIYNWLPNGKVQQELLDYIREDPRFVERERIDTFNHNAFVIFDKLPAAALAGKSTAHAPFRIPFSGYVLGEGWGPREGPYREAKLPVVIWGCYPVSKLTPETPGGGAYKLELEGMAHAPNQRAVVKANGKEVVAHDFHDVGVFEKFEAEFELPPGGQISIEYLFGDMTGNIPRAVLFKRIQLTKK